MSNYFQSADPTSGLIPQFPALTLQAVEEGPNGPQKFEVKFILTRPIISISASSAGTKMSNMYVYVESERSFVSLLD